MNLSQKLFVDKCGALAIRYTAANDALNRMCELHCKKKERLLLQKRFEPNHMWQTMLSIVGELHSTIAGNVLNFIAGALVRINSDDFVHTHSFSFVSF